MTTEEKIKIMQAHIDGKYIEFKLKDDKVWEDCGIPAWDWYDYEYRIKPEPKKPTYRPYKDAEEMIADYKERFGVNVPQYAMPLIWIKCGEDISLITAYRYNIVFVENAYYECINLKILFDMCEYLDGSPCGKLVEK